jgi:Protein NO VEIN, C-terminal
VGFCLKLSTCNYNIIESKDKMNRVSNEKKNLNRLAGEFLVASRLTQRGYMVTLQWGNTISYDILAFDKSGEVAFIEVKSTASYSRRWVLQSKYANPEHDTIPLKRRFICCVDISSKDIEPDVYVFPAKVVAIGLHYYFNSKFPNSMSYHLSLDFKPQGKSKSDARTVGEHIQAQKYLENFDILGLKPVLS